MGSSCISGMYQLQGGHTPPYPGHGWPPQGGPVTRPLDEELEAQRKARDWALEASKLDPPDGSNRVQSAAFQKARAREMACLKWTLDWYKQRARNTLNINAGGGPLDGHAHTFAITDPPNGHNRPLWTRAVDCHRDEQGRKISSKPLYTRHTTSTALQLAVDNVFTGSYAKRFRPANPPESHTCPCGYGLRTPTHTIIHRARHTQQHINTAIIGTRSPLPFTKPFTMKRGAACLLDFIQLTGVGSRPETSPLPPSHLVPEPNVPPEPD